MLVRDHGFVSVARPDGIRDEAMIVVPDDSPVQKVEDLPQGCRVASTDDPDVRMIGMIMLEPANLGPDTIVALERPTYVLVAKALLMGDADVGVFLADAYDRLSGTTRSGLRTLVASQIGVISHMLMVGPALAPGSTSCGPCCSACTTTPPSARSPRAWASTAGSPSTTRRPSS